MSTTVAAATAERWPDVVTALGRAAARDDSCWCQRFRGPRSAGGAAALRSEVEGGDVPVGLVAYVEGVPAGWSRVVPRHTLPGVVGNRALRRLLEEDPTAWWVACFAIRPEHRGRGVGVSLLQAAGDHARRHGATVLDGHPVDVARLAGRPSPSALFTGTLALFLAAGFREIGRTYPSRPVVRLELR